MNLAPKIVKTIGFLCVLFSPVAQADAADWSVNEVQFQYGKINNPFAGTDSPTTIFTLQHASGWAYGDNFFFVDLIDDSDKDGFNDKDYYGEFYANFSLGKITGESFNVGPLKDIGVLAGINAAGDANTLKYLPGMRLSWDVPGFAFLNTDFTAYIDDSDVAAAAEEGNSFMIDVNFARPLAIGDQSFSVEGHAEYIGARDLENVPGESKAWFLAQPQFRWDAGKMFFDKEDNLFLGIEYQYWNNKLGTNNDENTAQALLVWRL